MKLICVALVTGCLLVQLVRAGSSDQETLQGCRNSIVGKPVPAPVAELLRHVEAELPSQIAGFAGYGQKAVIDLTSDDVEGKFDIPMEDCLQFRNLAQRLLQSASCRPIWTSGPLLSGFRALIKKDGQLGAFMNPYHVCSLLTYKLTSQVPT